MMERLRTLVMVRRSVGGGGWKVGGVRGMQAGSEGGGDEQQQQQQEKAYSYSSSTATAESNSGDDKSKQQWEDAHKDKPHPSPRIVKQNADRVRASMNTKNKH